MVYNQTITNLIETMKATIAQLKKQIEQEYKKSLKPSSKWYKEDIQTFNRRLQGVTDIERLTTQLGNLRSLNGNNTSLTREVAKEVGRMEKGGMYNIGKMSPLNALD